MKKKIKNYQKSLSEKTKQGLPQYSEPLKFSAFLANLDWAHIAKITVATVLIGGVGFVFFQCTTSCSSRQKKAIEAYYGTQIEEYRILNEFFDEWDNRER